MLTTYRKVTFIARPMRCGEFLVELYYDNLGVDEKVDFEEILQQFVGSKVRITIEDCEE